MDASPSRRSGLAARSALLALFAAGALTAAADAYAQSTRVFLNGKRLSDAEVIALSRRNCAAIPDGAYWMNLQTGAWGYVGSRRVQGHFGDACRQSAGGGNARHGPYATLRRAEEVANGYRAQGFRAVAFHSGDGYYVNVRR